MALQWQETSPSSANNPWFAISMVLVGLIVGFGIATVMKGNVQIPSQKVAQAPSAPSPSAPTPQAPTPPPAGPVPPIDAKTDHIRGNLGTAAVAVIEYSDFECPFCKRHHPTMQQIIDTYKDDVVWVLRHFPLGFHQNAQKEAEASDCVAELGGNDAFWQYTDAIFERTTAGGTGFPLDQLAPLAKELGIDEGDFKSCLDSGKFAQHVQDDMSGGSTAGVNGTPGNIVLNLKTDESRIVSGAQPFNAFQSVIDAMLQSGSPPPAPVAEQTAPQGRVIPVTAELWKFTPNVFQAKQGEVVTLQVTGISGTHGFSVPDLGINQTIFMGKTVNIPLPTDRTGTFALACSFQCGSGHSDMTGQIVIEN